MEAPQRICCAVDGSEPSRAALDGAILLASRYRAELHLVHVHEREGSGAYPFAPPPSPRRRSAPWDLSAWESEARAAAPGRVRAFVRAGDPAAEILAHAAEHDCDLVVLGTHGRTGLRRIFSGSVAEAVWRRAACPVLVVKRPRAELAPPRGLEPPLGDEPSGLP
jgi:nucleotide-binding universal stress UspA family protein